MKMRVKQENQRPPTKPPSRPRTQAQHWRRVVHNTHLICSCSIRFGSACHIWTPVACQRDWKLPLQSHIDPPFHDFWPKRSLQRDLTKTDKMTMFWNILISQQDGSAPRKQWREILSSHTDFPAVRRRSV